MMSASGFFNNMCTLVIQGLNGSVMAYEGGKGWEGEGEGKDLNVAESHIHEAQLPGSCSEFGDHVTWEHEE